MDQATDFNVTPKKTVHYSGAVRFEEYQGKRFAFVTPVDHPDNINVINGEEAQTSTVEEWDEGTGILVTKRTIYKPQVVA